MPEYQITLDEYLAQLPRTRVMDWSTSIAAAAGVNLSAGRLLALRTLAEHPAGLTDFELAEITGRQQTSIGKRRGELYDAGLVEAATNERGEIVKRPSPSGALSIVWRITALGLQYLEVRDTID